MTADSTTGDHSPGSPRPREMSLARRVVFWGFATLVVLAVAFFVWWGVTFHVWFDNGVYAVFITLFLFGVAGMWLMLPNPPSASPNEP